MSCLIGPSIVTECASDDKCLGSLADAVFAVKLSSINPSSKLLDYKFFASINSSMSFKWEKVTCEQ